MVNLKKYFLSLLFIIILTSCYKFSDETFRHLSVNERRSLSAEYTQLAKRLESGSPRSMMILEKAIRINPKNDLAWRELSLPYLNAGLYKEWHTHIDKAIELNPEAWQAWRGYDRLFYFRDYSGALFDLDATDTLTRNQVDYPQNISVDYLRGLCYFGLKDYNKSIEYFNKFIIDETEKLGEAYVEEAAFLYLGLISMENGKWEEARAHFQRGLKFEDSFADFNFHLARIFCLEDNPLEAAGQLEIARNKFEDGNYLRAYRYEAICQLYKSDFDALDEQINYSLAMGTNHIKNDKSG